MNCNSIIAKSETRHRMELATLSFLLSKAIKNEHTVHASALSKKSLYNKTSQASKLTIKKGQSQVEKTQ